MRTTSSNMTEPDATVPQSRFPGEREGEMDLETFVREEEEVVRTETQMTCLSSYVDEGSTESHRYYLSRRTVMEMLKDRGYAVPIEQIQVTLQEFRAIYGQTPNLDLLSVSFSHRSHPSKKIKVIFSGPGVVKVHMIRNLAGQIGNHGSYSGMILILENRITNPALKAVDLFSFKVEIFQITDLLVNITKHVLKPKHRILSKAEKQNLLKNYNIEEKQLPRMLKTDAIARYYGLQRGQVVKIIYNSGITKSHVTYRCVW